jgi:hypothetical protein
MAQLDSTYGAMLIGVYFATFLQGLLTFQTYRYFDKYPNDPIVNKIIVFTVWSFDAIQLIFIAKSAYYYLVTQWGNPEALATSIWELDIQLTFIGLSAFVCQLFFLNRIWVLSKKNIVLVACLFCLCLTTLALDIVVTVQITTVRLVTEFGRRKAEIIAVFTSGAAADVFIAISLCYYLSRDKAMFQRTKSIVKKVVQFTIATGILTSAFAIASIIAYFSNEGAFYFIAIHFSLGRMYTNALLATLNSREQLRVNIQTGQTSSGSRRGGLSVSNTSTLAQFVTPFSSKTKVNTGSGFTNYQPDPVEVNYTVEQSTEHDIEMSDSVKMRNIV